MVDQFPSDRIEADLVPDYSSPEDDFIISGNRFPEFARKMHISRNNEENTMT